MTGIIQRTIVAVLAFALLAGCSETTFQEATGKGSINAINAMPASPPVALLIEERALGAISYKESRGAQSFDDLSYNFNFDYVPLGETSATRIATQFIDVIADTDYTLVISGSITAPVLTQWERPEREWEGDETVFEVAFAHLSPALGDVDIYLAPIGTLPVLGEERAKVSNGDLVPEIDLESDDYEIIITPRDNPDPAAILYQSHPVSLVARLAYTVAIFDADPSITGNISVRVMSQQDGFDVELPDLNFLPTLRTVHASLSSSNFDIYREMDFTTPIFSDLGFLQSTGDVPVPEGIATYTYTQVGLPGMIIDEASQQIVRGIRTSTIVAGQFNTDLARIVMNDDRRSIETHAKLRFVHAALNIQIMDLYMVLPGTDITDRNPLISDLTYSFSSNFSPTLAGTYDLILTLPDDKTPLAMLPPVVLANGDVVEIVFVDTLDPLVPDVYETRF